MFQICDELYKYELMSVFKVDTIENKKVQETLTHLWIIAQLYPSFIKVIEIYNKNYSLIDLEQTFVLMFNYSLFIYMHKCISAMLKRENDLFTLFDV